MPEKGTQLFETDEGTIVIYATGREFAFRLADYEFDHSATIVGRGLFRTGRLWTEWRITKKSIVGKNDSPDPGWSRSQDEFMCFGTPFVWRVIRGQQEETYWQSRKPDEMAMGKVI